MPRIEIRSPEADGRTVSAHGTRVWMDGQEVQELTNVSAEWPVDGLATVTLGVLATDSLNFVVADARVNIDVLCDAEHEIVATEMDGQHLGTRVTIYRCRRRRPLEIAFNVAMEDNLTPQLMRATAAMRALNKEMEACSAQSSSLWSRVQEYLQHVHRRLLQWRRSSKHSERNASDPRA